MFGTYGLEEIKMIPEPDMVRSHFDDMTKVHTAFLKNANDL